jgi:N-dimethylarginine dimethylaminohydrolase
MKLPAPRHILMTTPTGFRIAYGINPHMFDANGNLNQVDSATAYRQWQAMRELYQDLGLTVHTIEGRDEFPDLVFTANPTFPYLKNGKPGVVLANMHSEFRRKETEIHAAWARENGCEVSTISKGCFEGSGDALWSYETGEIFGGYGIRTELGTYDELETITGAKVHRLEMISPTYYHLDTCLVILNAKTACYVAEAFAPEALRTLEKKFDDLIRIPAHEAIDGFAGNAFCPDGRNVVLQAGNHHMNEALESKGFRVHPVETSEFIKSGGSVFCTKQLLWV